MCVTNPETQHRYLCVVAKLRRKGFHSYAASSKKEIIKAGRPKPNELPFLTTKKTARRKDGKRQEYVMRFKPAAYDQHEWICACCAEDAGGLFCWPCLLFNNATQVKSWIEKPYRDMNNLSGEANRHSKLESHITSALALANFGQAGRMQVTSANMGILKVPEHNSAEVISPPAVAGSLSWCLVCGDKIQFWDSRCPDIFSTGMQCAGINLTYSLALFGAVLKPFEPHELPTTVNYKNKLFWNMCVKLCVSSFSENLHLLLFKARRN
jgi:hypothetical protein